MDDTPFSRRETLRVAAGTTAGIALAGCLERLPLVGGGSEPPSVGPVPADVTVFATVDVGALLEGDAPREVIENAVPITDIDGLSELVTSAVGLDPRRVERAVGFASPTAESMGPAGVVIETDWSTTELVTAIEERGYTLTETTLDGRQAYEVDGTDASMATLPDDRTVVGIAGAVGAVVATNSGSNDRLGRAVRRAYGRVSSGPIRFAVDVRALDETIVAPIAEQLPRFSRDVVEELQFVAGSLYTAEEQPGIELMVTTGDETAARQVEQFVEAVPTIVDQHTGDQELRATLETAKISRDGTRVTMALEGTVAQLEPITDLFRVRVLRALASSDLSGVS